MTSSYSHYGAGYYFLVCVCSVLFPLWCCRSPSQYRSFFCFVLTDNTACSISVRIMNKKCYPVSVCDKHFVIMNRWKRETMTNRACACCHGRRSCFHGAASSSCSQWCSCLRTRTQWARCTISDSSATSGTPVSGLVPDLTSTEQVGCLS